MQFITWTKQGWQQSSIDDRAQQVVSRKGRNQIGCINAGEKGKIVILALTVFAARNCTIFFSPRRRFDQNLLLYAPSKSAGEAVESGWMTRHINLQFLKHFKIFANLTRLFSCVIFEQPQKSSSIEAIEYCCANLIHMISFPSRCVHQLQRPDVSIFDPSNVLLIISV